MIKGKTFNFQDFCFKIRPKERKVIMKILEEPGRFFINDATGKMVAEIKYLSTKNGKVLNIVHTFVADSMRGQGIAKQLLKKVIELAKNNNAQIIPTCSYAKAAFAANPDYQKLAIKNPNEEANDES